MQLSTPKLIHAARISLQNRGQEYLFLREIEPFRYVWFSEDSPVKETETKIWGGTIEEAIHAALRAWKDNEIRTVHCGFRYTLPERDEVGSNALMHQMIASYSSSSGVYFDEELGSNCMVHFASIEARALWKRKSVQKNIVEK